MDRKFSDEVPIRVNIDVVGVQQSSERWPPNKHRRTTAAWRNNLTAMSQNHNLMFVAQMETVQVYRPQFPSQKLPFRPEMTLTLPRHDEHVAAYLDQTNPHAINHLIVADLGDEEVLVCACDDGDVIAYHTRPIYRDLITDTQEFGADFERTHKPFFHNNVGASAWGLAVHRHGRMIAVSSNRKHITVFAFAIAKEPTSPESESDGDSVMEDKGHVEEEKPKVHPGRDSPKDGWHTLFGSHGRHPSPPFSRDRNIRIILTGHTENIPCVSFWNKEEDDGMEVLVSTDIEGAMMHWSVRERTAVQTYQFEDVPGKELHPSEDWDPEMYRSHTTWGWGALCLDLAAFKRTTDYKSTFGKFRPERSPSCNCWEVTGTVKQQVPWRPDQPSADADPLLHPGMPPIDDLDPGTESDGSTVMDVALDVVQETASTQSDESEAGEEEEDDDVDANNPAEASEGDQADIATPAEDSAPNEGASNSSPLHTSQSPPAGDQEGSSVDSDEAMAGSDGWEGWVPQRGEFAILHTTKRNIRMLPAPCKEPALIHRKPLLNPVIERSLATNQGIRIFERLNMLQAIPELGLVLVGCQAGRVAMLSLTLWAAEYTPAFRVETIVPFKSQEFYRDKSPLLGFAVGPMQGLERASRHPDDVAGSERSMTDWRNREQTWRRAQGQRRYRLLLTFYDGSILSYEIGRKSEADYAAEILVI